MTRRTRPQRRGFTMLVVLIFLAVGLILVSVNQRRIGALLRLERARISQSDFDEGPVQVLGEALSLLETGEPPYEPYACEKSVTTAQGVLTFQVTFTDIGSDDWMVEVVPLPPASVLPAMPATFFVD